MNSVFTTLTQPILSNLHHRLDLTV